MKHTKQHVKEQREMNPVPQCEDEIYDDLYEVTEREGRILDRASGGGSKTASISSLYVAPLGDSGIREE